MIREEFFTYIHDRDTGHQGWAMAHVPWMDPGPAMAVAHDFLEHLDTQEGIEAECRAFGAMALVRGEGGYWSSFSNPYRDDITTYAEVFPELAGFLEEREWAIQDTEFIPLSSDDMCWEFLERLGRYWLEWGSKLWHNGDMDHDEMLQAIEAGRRAMCWVSVGIRDAIEKYDTNPQTLASCFWEIENSVLDASSNVNEGDELRICLNDDYSVSVTVWTGYDLNGDLFQDGERVGPEDD